MLPQVEAPQNGTTPEATYNDGLTDAYCHVQTWEQKEDDKVRTDPDLCAQLVKLIPELGDLIRTHARQFGERTGEDCPFQVDDHAEKLLWMLIEFLSQSEYDGEAREGNVRAFQLTTAHAAYYFDMEAE